MAPRRKKSHPNKNRRLRVRSIRRADPDLRRLGRVLIELAQAEAEAAAQREHENRTTGSGESRPERPEDGEAA